MKGKDIVTYVVEFEELVHLAGYHFDVPQTIETFTNGLPTGLYQKILKINQPITYEQWKQAATDRQQQYIHMKARLKAHCGGFMSAQPQGWVPIRLLMDPNTMDTSTGRTCG